MMTLPVSPELPLPVAPGLTAEDRLHDNLVRLAGGGAGFYAVHLHMARAAETVAGAERVRRALRPLELLASVHDARLFCLSEGHVVLVCKDGVPVDQVDAAIGKVRSSYLGTIEDWTWDCDDDPDAEWYDFAQAEDLEKLLALTAARCAQARNIHAEPASAPDAPAVRCLNAEDLGAICRRVEQADLAAVVRQQTALDVVLNAAPLPLFKETYVSMQDLRALVAPNIDMFASGWLFRYLTEILDRRMLEFLAGQTLACGPVPISLNLNIASLATPGFQRFLDGCDTMPGKPIVEIQLVDLLANSATFAKIRPTLQARGHRVLIDGLTPLTLQVVDLSALRSDFVKIWWREDAPTIFPARRVSGLREVIERVGRERVILARAESEQALEWGVEHGIRRFQGRFVDRLLGALAGKCGRDPGEGSTMGTGHAPRA
jgi:EAL domain-containing protein (putative c-di-GMP-specific phosphodiesterase class I)